MRDILTINEVSEMTGTSVNTLYWLRSTGGGGPKSGKLGRRVVYRLADFEAWIESAFNEGAK